MTGTNPSSYKTDVRLLKLSVKREFTVNRKGDGGIRDSTRKLKAARLSQIFGSNLFPLKRKGYQSLKSPNIQLFLKRGVEPV